MEYTGAYNDLTAGGQLPACWTDGYLASVLTPRSLELATEKLVRALCTSSLHSVT
jgi:hypothetical protein